MHRSPAVGSAPAPRSTVDQGLPRLRPATVGAGILAGIGILALLGSLGSRLLYPSAGNSLGGGGSRPPVRERRPPESAALQAALLPLVQSAERRRVARRVGLFLAPARPGARPWVRYRAEESFPSASVIKVPVMVAIQERWSRVPGARSPVQERALARMIRASHNDATNQLIDALGGCEPVNAALRRILGLRTPTTRLARRLNASAKGRPLNRAAPEEVGRLLAWISQGEETGSAAAREMMYLLRTTTPDHRRRIPAGVPPPYRDRVANKTGTLNRPGVVNDAAVIETAAGDRYVLCVFLDGVPHRGRAERLCTSLTRTCWDHLRRAARLSSPLTRERPAPWPTTNTTRGR